MPVAPSITWLLVSTSPPGVTTIPVPAAVAPSSDRAEVTSTMAGSSWVAISEALSCCWLTDRAPVDFDPVDDGPSSDATTMPIPRAASRVANAAMLPTVRRARRWRRCARPEGGGGGTGAPAPVGGQLHVG